MKKRALQADIQHNLEKRLLLERDLLIDRHPMLKMLPKSVICPLSVIKDVCSRSRGIKGIEDLKLLPCIRPEFHLPFLSILREFAHNEPLSKRIHV